MTTRPSKRAKASKTKASGSERITNRDGTLKWDSEKEEGEYVVKLFNMNQNDPSKGADPKKATDPAYIRSIYNGHVYLSGPDRLTLSSFREAYKRLAKDYLNNLEGRSHQGK